MSDSTQPHRGSVWKGIVIGIALTAAVLSLTGGLYSIQTRPGVLDAVWFVVLFYVGGVQVLWMLPAALAFRAKQQNPTAQGILIATVIVFLLNAVPLILIMTRAIRLPGP